MTLFTKAQTEQLLANCQEQIVNNDAGHPDIDFKPVVKLFTPDAQCTWLLTELGLDDIAYGLCDLGMGMPEIGFVCVRELREARGPLGLPIERDEHSTPIKRCPLTQMKPATTGASSLDATLTPPTFGSAAPRRLAGPFGLGSRQAPRSRPRVGTHHLREQQNFRARRRRARGATPTRPHRVSAPRSSIASRSRRRARLLSYNS